MVSSTFTHSASKLTGACLNPFSRVPELLSASSSVSPNTPGGSNLNLENEDVDVLRTGGALVDSNGDGPNGDDGMAGGAIEVSGECV